MIRYINQNPMMKQCIDGALSVAGKGMIGSANMFQFDSKSNSGKTKPEAAEYLAPVPKAVPEKKRYKKRKRDDK